MGKEKGPPKGKKDPLENRSAPYPGSDQLSSSNGYPSPKRVPELPENFDSLPPEEQEKWRKLLEKRNKGLDKL